MNITKRVKGYCPYLNKEHSIKIDYLEVPMCNVLKRQYKKGNYSCAYYDECTQQNKRSGCKVYLEATSDPE